MSKLKKIIILLMLVVLFPFLCVAIGWAVTLGGMWIFTPNPEQPQEVYGEFPFELTYKIDGETMTVHDIYVCEYGGIGFNEGNGKHRTWNGYIKGTGEETVFLTEDSEWKIYCIVGDAGYYMGDEGYSKNYTLVPRVYREKNGAEGSVYSVSDEIMESYKIEIISWTFSEPIENSFN